MAKMHTYNCSKCGIVVQNESTPNYGSCPKGGSHNWSRLTRFIKQLLNW